MTSTSPGRRQRSSRHRRGHQDDGRRDASTGAEENGGTRASAPTAPTDVGTPFAQSFVHGRFEGPYARVVEDSSMSHLRGLRPALRSRSQCVASRNEGTWAGSRRWIPRAVCADQHLCLDARGRDVGLLGVEGGGHPDRDVTGVGRGHRATECQSSRYRRLG